MVKNLPLNMLYGKLALTTHLISNTAYNLSPPPSQTNHSMHPVFLDEFADYMENFLTINHNIVIAGDFNLHIDHQEHLAAQLFTDMMDALGLECHINFPTHQSGHSLDPVFTEALNEMKVIRCNPGTYL